MIAIYSYRVVCISTQCNISLFKFMIYKKCQHLWFTVSVRITLALSGGCPWCDFRTGYEKTICGLILWLQLRFKRKMSSFSLMYVQGLTMENLKKSWNFKTTLQKWVENLRVKKKKKRMKFLLSTKHDTIFYKPWQNDGKCVCGALLPCYSKLQNIIRTPIYLKQVGQIIYIQFFVGS